MTEKLDLKIEKDIKNENLDISDTQNQIAKNKDVGKKIIEDSNRLWRDFLKQAKAPSSNPEEQSQALIKEAKKLTALFPERKSSIWQLMIPMQNPSMTPGLEIREGLNIRINKKMGRMFGVSESDDNWKDPDKKKNEDWTNSIDPRIETHIKLSVISLYLEAIKINPQNREGYLDFFTHLDQIKFETSGIKEFHDKAIKKINQLTDKNKIEKAYRKLAENIEEQIGIIINIHKMLAN